MAPPSRRAIEATSQHLGDPVEKALEGYALAVGKVVRAWNNLQERLGQLFSVILGADYSIAIGVWYSSDSDRTQQSMLRAAIEGIHPDRWPERPKAKEDLRWLITEASKLADHRNNAIHTPVAVWLGGAPGDEVPAAGVGQRSLLGIGPVAFRGHPRAQRMTGKRLLDEFDWCEQWTVALSRFAQGVEIALGFGPPHPWPAKPRRPTHGQKNTPQDPPPRPPRPRSRPRRRQSSPT